ncbi:uncharacterized protein LOC135922012 isoform X1 [Gordionus sp. m RMFG-2023]|uniref:uncharacterized protein LOC135922012 isoform X1 n=1 Tax=Gordionus sp. m RMFG-2023 TaxID=3053472 RepID=UPI0031FDE5D4
MNNFFLVKRDHKNVITMRKEWALSEPPKFDILPPPSFFAEHCLEEALIKPIDLLNSHSVSSKCSRPYSMNPRNEISPGIYDNNFRNKDLLLAFNSLYKDEHSKNGNNFSWISSSSISLADDDVKGGYRKYDDLMKYKQGGHDWMSDSDANAKVVEMDVSVGFWVTIVVSSLFLASLLFLVFLTGYFIYKKNQKQLKCVGFKKDSCLIYKNTDNLINKKTNHLDNLELSNSLLEDNRNHQCIVVPVQKISQTQNTNLPWNLLCANKTQGVESEKNDKFYYYYNINQQQNRWWNKYQHKNENTFSKETEPTYIIVPMTTNDPNTNNLNRRRLSAYNDYSKDFHNDSKTYSFQYHTMQYPVKSKLHSNNNIKRYEAYNQLMEHGAIVEDVPKLIEDENVSQKFVSELHINRNMAQSHLNITNNDKKNAINNLPDLTDCHYSGNYPPIDCYKYLRLFRYHQDHISREDNNVKLNDIFKERYDIFPEHNSSAETKVPFCLSYDAGNYLSHIYSKIDDNC